MILLFTGWKTNITPFVYVGFIILIPDKPFWGEDLEWLYPSSNCEVDTKWTKEIKGEGAEGEFKSHKLKKKLTSNVL